ncbi:MAG: DoxX family membrane protein [Candidatus Omnitrophica bacterium]|nr:DoxX family membrane protein [Candidatus Omnitrophota bacterium]
MKSGNNKELGYLLLRVSMGVNMLMHGLVRMGEKTPAFVGHMTDMFSGSSLPEPLVRYFAYTIIPVETLIGAALIAGLFTLTAGLAGATLMVCFMFGACLLEKWSLAGTQLIYVIVFFLIIFYQEYDRYSLDSLRERGRA